MTKKTDMIMVRVLWWFIGFLSAIAFVVVFPAPAEAFSGVMNDVTDIREIGTEYQNELPNDIIIYINTHRIGGSGPSDLLLYASTTNSDLQNPDYIAGYETITFGDAENAEYETISFMVPSGWWYLATSPICGSNCEVQTWWEYVTPSAGGGSATTTIEFPSEISVDNPIQTYFNAIMLFFLVMGGTIWFFRKRA